MKLSLVQKLWLPLILSLISLAGISIYDAYTVREMRLQERKADLEHASEVALSVVKTLGDAASAGTMPEAAAKSGAMNAVRNMRYGGSGYFTILNSEPRVLMHPIHPEMDGKDVADFKDANGVHLFEDIVALIKRDGKGFNAFSFPKPGATAPAPKIAYNVVYPRWDWILSTGVYVDDINAAFRATLFRDLGILAMLASVLLSVVAVLNRGILRSLGGEPAYAAQIATRIAQNDLTSNVETARRHRGSLLGSMQRMQEQLAATIRSIRQSADSVAVISREIAGGNAALSSRTEEQAASLEETAASMTGLTETVKQTADNARQANELAMRATGIADAGHRVVDDMIGTIERISESSVRISEITGMIEGIAFQTNILALNAAVEAARAGDHGRGFAVVAAEVRGLAQRAASAAREIKGLIETSSALVGDGSCKAHNVGATMGDVRQAIAQTADIVGEIAAASAEQSRSIEQVKRAVLQMDAVTQRNAALVEQAGAAAHSLEAQAGELTAAVSLFKLVEAA
ncbi:methyl-accepting chemotaxis protein [Trinickia dinghuensis]|uniref:Methyl-accepting chemotaxis protein n=1 Tax=Trinickia dinghuensis TaxID=2291023 RepID=A0A3D8K1B9_9BURK|nr:methyl-accepting chemotaxis protein [Trinickia dinghuensis]RDU98862.1 methyl-accepting chemotaxis protein [Trinickia dinghuensis]